jgi:metal-responsive CopG/Arc/MetJ family transcriptional regulator
MKTAISLPDELFTSADVLARRLGKSRSQLYAEAVAEYLVRHEPETVTDRLNAVHDQLTDGEDRFAAAGARAILDAVEW